MIAATGRMIGLRLPSVMPDGGARAAEHADAERMTRTGRRLPPGKALRLRKRLGEKRNLLSQMGNWRKLTLCDSPA